MSKISEFSSAISAIDKYDFSNTWTRVATNLTSGTPLNQLTDEQAANYKQLAIDFSNREKNLRNSIGVVADSLTGVIDLLFEAYQYVNYTITQIEYAQEDISKFEEVRANLLQLSYDLEDLRLRVKELRSKLNGMN